MKALSVLLLSTVAIVCGASTAVAAEAPAPKIILCAGSISNPVKCLTLTSTTSFTQINAAGFNDVTSSVIVVSGVWRLWEGNIGDGLPSGVVHANGGPDKDGVYPFPTVPLANDALSSVEKL